MVLRSMETTAAQLMDSITSGWNLGNTLDAYGRLKGKHSPKEYETVWHNPPASQEMFRIIKDEGFNAIRVPITWREHIDDEGNIDPDWLDRVNEVVDYAVDLDLYCIINIHHDCGERGWIKASEESFVENKAKLENIWTQLGERFKDYDARLIIEGYNEILDRNAKWTEPAEDSSYEIINRYNQLFVDAVRKTGGNNALRCLMLQTYSAACTERTLNGFKLPKDTVPDRLIIQVHNYDPQTFTFPEAPNNKSRAEWGSDEDIAILDKLFAELAEYADKMGCPVTVGECSAIDKNNNSHRTAYAYDFVSRATLNNIKCIWWDTPDMGFLDRNNLCIKHRDICDAIIRGFSVKK